MARPDLPPRWLSGVLIGAAIAVAWVIETPRRKRSEETGILPSHVTDVPATEAERAPLVASAPAALPSLSDPARSPYRQSWSWWRQVLFNTYIEIGNDRLLSVAAGVVFFALLSIFPTITAFVSFYGLFASYKTIGDHLFMLSYVLPPGGVGIVNDQIARIISNNDGALGAAFAVGLAIALWSANAGIKAVIDALNVIEGTPERRGFLALNGVSLSFTLGAIGFLLTAVGAVVAFPLIMSMFGLQAVTSTFAWLVRWPLMLAVIMVGLSILYRFGPSREKGRWRIISPGIMFAAFAWIAGSSALSFYLSNFADYNATYGSLGAAIGLMMWMWLTTIVVLAGAELDSEVDKAIEQGAPRVAEVTV